MKIKKVMVVPIGLGFSLALAAPAWSAAPEGTGACPGSPATIETIADGLNAVDCPVVGEMIEFGGVGAPIPEPGSGISAIAATTDSLDRSISIEVSLDGAVVATVEGPAGELQPLKERAARADRNKARKGQGAQRLGGVRFRPLPQSQVIDEGGTSLPKCSDNAYSLLGQKWASSSPAYAINDTEAIGSGVTGAQFASATQGASNTIGAGIDSCGLAGDPNIGFTVGARTTANTNINGAANACASASDGLSVVDFGNLVGTTVGLACTRWTNGRFSEGDIRLDNSSRSWAYSTSGCSGKMDMQSVLTHEFGHFVGLGHVTERGIGDLVMSTSSAQCDFSQRLLGKGDLAGLMALYP